MKSRLALMTVTALLALMPPGALAAKPLPPVAAASPQRLLPLEGGRNFRDLGGYQTADGRSVKWNTLFRSGSMHGLTAADFAYLESRSIRTVCDFRDTRERAAEPVHWLGATPPKVFSDDYNLDMASFLPPGAPAGWTALQVEALMTASYPHMLEQFNGQYRRMFGELLAHRVPLAFNCSAGKDRTGIAAALLLTALGVPRETVIADYLLTNQYLDPAKLVSGSSRGPANPMAQLPPEIMKPLLAADRRYIEAAFHVIDTHPGGAKGYLHDALGLSTDDLTRLRALYLE
jgi:protein-tyrosine phosphatase